MRSVNMAKIAINAVRLPKFEPVDGISWSPRKMMLKFYGNVPGWRDFAHAQRAAWSLTQGHTLFCQITPFIFIVAPKSYIVNRQIGIRDFKYVGKICRYA